MITLYIRLPYVVFRTHKKLLFCMFLVFDIFCSIQQFFGINMSPKPLKIFFHAVEGIGHLNGCIGLAQALAKRGHKIYFLMGEEFRGKLTLYGFEEIMLQKPEPPKVAEEDASKTDVPEKPKNHLKEFSESLLKSEFLSPKSPLEKMKTQLEDKEDKNGRTTLENRIFADPQIEQAIEREKPDLFIIDSFAIPPAVQKAPIPWVFLCSAQPLCLLPTKGKLPQFGAGFASNSNPDTWEEYNRVWKQYREEKFIKNHDQLNQALNFSPTLSINNGETLFYNSPYLNIYGYPEELDYSDIFQIPDNFVRVDSLMRDVLDGPFVLPESFSKLQGDKLIYLSLGSMGSIDVELMKRITSVLGKTPYKYIVSKGQRGEEYELPDNCWGENFLPQTRILPLVDLVITHGGNNTVCESFLFGKPMIVLPLFGDQYDSAQRVHEKGYGIRLEAYTFKDNQLTDAIDKLLNDAVLHQRLKVSSDRMQNSNTKQKVCERLELEVEKYQTN